MEKDPFKEYLIQSEPDKREKEYAWHTAIGLQAVDGLKPLKYLIDTAIKNIEGDISIDEAQELLNSYYKENPKKDIEDREFLLCLGGSATTDGGCGMAAYLKERLKSRG